MTTILTARGAWFKCYLCPGNERAQGDTNPNYESTFVFVNDYSAVKECELGICVVWCGCAGRGLDVPSWFEGS
jgi:hypothetical protein